MPTQVHAKRASKIESNGDRTSNLSRSERKDEQKLDAENMIEHRVVKEDELCENDDNGAPD